MKNIKFCTIVLFLLLSLSGCGNSENTTPPSTSAGKVSTNIASNPEQINRITMNATSTTEEELKSFSTKFAGSAESRIHNITLVCEKLNGHIVEPNSEFSFLTTVGNLDAASGYKEADVIVGNKTKKGYGGGACQVSSTLFNAIDGISGVTITERHEHGKDVYYVPDGRDAAISHSSKLDFKFKNNNSYKLKINATAENGEIKMSIMKI